MSAALPLLACLFACGGGSSADTAAQADTTVIASAEALAVKAATVTSQAAVVSDNYTYPTNGATLAGFRTLGGATTLAVAGVSETPLPAPALALDAAGRTYYVDSANGNDTYTGRAATSGAASAGPWRSLARLLTADIAAGDTVVLACGSSWRETLRLPASGTAARPITVGGPRSGCGTRPTIDGGLTLAPAAWTLHSGKIYKQPMTTAPLQLYTGVGAFTEAHHPNRGTAPGSTPYATLAADGDVVSYSTRQGSTQLYTGADLALPAGAVVAAGARVRVLTNSWLMDESTISAVNGIRLTLTNPTSYPVQAGWGYFLLGQLWMLDSAGEWYYDATAKTLYAWMPDSASPAAVTASVLATGIDLTSRGYITVDGIAVRRVGTGILMRGLRGITVRNSTIEDTVGMGADAAYSLSATFESNSFKRTGVDAISGQDDTTGAASGMIVRNNVIRDSGLVMQGETILSLPRRSFAAIRSGETSQVSGNTVINAGYIGIRPSSNSVVENNFVYGACSVLDDCGGIYSWSSNSGVIRGNTVVHTRGNLLGKPTAARASQAQGIYLDELATGFTVDNNTVIDADNGILVHLSYNNSFSNNRLYGNRVSQIWMQDGTTRKSLSGDVFGNTVTGNLIAATAPGSVGLLLQTQLASTSYFGSFSGNHYDERASATVTQVDTATSHQALTLAQWRQSHGVGSTQPVDQGMLGVNEHGYASYTVSGSNLIPNSALLQNTAGWSGWNATAPVGQLLRQTCAAGICLRYVPGGSSGLVSSPNFSVQQGQWYRLTLDLAADIEGQAVQVIARRGGGGSNGYESIADRNLALSVGTAWGRYSIVFQATATIIAGNKATGDNGARVDIDGLVPGKSLSLARMELVPITPDATAQLTAAIVNVDAAPTTFACPLTAAAAAQCGAFVNLAGYQLVAWPQTVPGRSAAILYAQNPALLDSDGDGIPDSQDLCPGTAPGSTVNASGCSFSQR